MNLTLKRNSAVEDGIFGRLDDEQGKEVAVTLEHAYATGDGTFAAKIPPGTYTCKRSPHRLHGMDSDFITFQVMDVPSHDNILFHWGNYNHDSDGCILLGQNIVPRLLPSSKSMITNSRATWQRFMDVEKDVDSFTLTVIGV